MDEGINWAVWIGITISGLLGLSSLLYNVRRDCVRVVIVPKTGWEKFYKKEEDGTLNKLDFLELQNYEAIITNRGFVGVEIQEVEVKAADSQHSFSLIRSSHSKGKLVDGDHEIWGHDLDEVRYAFGDVPFHANTYVVATDTAERTYRSREWLTIRTFKPDLKDALEDE